MSLLNLVTFLFTVPCWKRSVFGFFLKKEKKLRSHGMDMLCKYYFCIYISKDESEKGLSDSCIHLHLFRSHPSICQSFNLFWNNLHTSHHLYKYISLHHQSLYCLRDQPFFPMYFLSKNNNIESIVHFMTEIKNMNCYIVLLFMKTNKTYSKWMDISLWLTLYLLNFLNGIAHLPFLELSIIIFRYIKIGRLHRTL